MTAQQQKDELLYTVGTVRKLSMNVSMKGIHSPKPANDPGCSDNIGRLAIESYLCRDKDSSTNPLVVLMDKVVRQQDKEFLNVLDLMRN
eukprot:8306664-Ditylum_brightwellii.AAC.1